MVGPGGGLGPVTFTAHVSYAPTPSRKFGPLAS